MLPALQVPLFPKHITGILLVCLAFTLRRGGGGGGSVLKTRGCHLLHGLLRHAECVAISSFTCGRFAACHTD